jgi:hypothetical protein
MLPCIKWHILSIIAVCLAAFAVKVQLVCCLEHCRVTVANQCNESQCNSPPVIWLARDIN